MNPFEMRYEENQPLDNSDRKSSKKLIVGKSRKVFSDPDWFVG